MTKENIQKRIEQLEKFLSERPDSGDGDWSFMEDSQNDLIEEDVKKEIKRLKKLIN